MNSMTNRGVAQVDLCDLAEIDCSAVAKCTVSALRYCQTQTATTAATRRPEVPIHPFAASKVLQTFFLPFPLQLSF